MKTVTVPLLFSDVSVRAMNYIIARIEIVIPTTTFCNRIPLHFPPLEGDRGQAATTIERIILDARHAVRNRDRRQAGATIKST